MWVLCLSSFDFYRNEMIEKMNEREGNRRRKGMESMDASTRLRILNFTSRCNRHNWVGHDTSYQMLKLCKMSRWKVYEKFAKWMLKCEAMRHQISSAFDLQIIMWPRRHHTKTRWGGHMIQSSDTMWQTRCTMSSGKEFGISRDNFWMM